MANNTIGVNDLLAQMRAMADQTKGIQNTLTKPAMNTVAGIDKGVTAIDTENAFSTLLKNSINKVNDTQMQTNKLQEAFQKGDPDVQIAEVMLAMQKSNVSFQAMVQVRNKIVQAYQEIMNMPV